MYSCCVAQPLLAVRRTVPRQHESPHPPRRSASATTSPRHATLLIFHLKANLLSETQPWGGRANGSIQCLQVGRGSAEHRLRFNKRYAYNQILKGRVSTDNRPRPDRSRGWRVADRRPHYATEIRSPPCGPDRKSVV